MVSHFPITTLQQFIMHGITLSNYYPTTVYNAWYHTFHEHFFPSVPIWNLINQFITPNIALPDEAVYERNG